MPGLPGREARTIVSDAFFAAGSERFDSEGSRKGSIPTAICTTCKSIRKKKGQVRHFCRAL
jgi:hypothetical protein